MLGSFAKQKWSHLPEGFLGRGTVVPAYTYDHQYCTYSKSIRTYMFFTSVRYLFFLYYIISRSCHIYFYDFFLYCIWFHICIVHSNYLFNGFFTALEKNIAKHIIPFQRSAPKHRQYVAETRETKLNNERQRKNECHTSVIDSRCPSRCFRQFPGYFSKIRPICFLFIYQLDLSTWFEMGCILVVWVGALKSWNLDDFFQVHWATIDLDSF